MRIVWCVREIGSSYRNLTRLPPPTSPRSALLPIAADRNTLAFDRSAPQGIDDPVGDLVRDLDQREPFGDLDGADGPWVDARLVHDGAHEIRRAHLGQPPGADVESRHIPLRGDALPLPTSAARARLGGLVAPRSGLRGGCPLPIVAARTLGANRHDRNLLGLAHTLFGVGLFD